MAVGPEIRRLRAERGMTQAELGAPLFTHAYISSIESGRRNPSRRALEHIATKLAVGVEDLEAGRPPGIEAELTLRMHEARLLASTGSPADAEGDFERLEHEAREYSLPHLTATAIEGRALCVERGGDPEAAIEIYERAEEAAAELGPRAVADPLVGRSRCLHMLGDIRYAIYILENHLERLRAAGIADPDSIVRLHSALMGPYIDTGLYRLAAASARLVMSLRSTVNDPFRRATMFLNVARVMHHQGRHDEALDMLSRAEQLFHQAEFVREAGMAHLADAFVLSDEERFEEALAELDDAANAFDSTGTPVDIARVLNEKGRVLRLMGRLDEAAETLSHAIPLFEQREVQELAQAHRELALCHLNDDVALAEKHLRAAIEHYERTEDQVQLAVTYRYLGDLYVASDRRAAGAEIYRAGLQVLRERS